VYPIKNVARLTTKEIGSIVQENSSPAILSPETIGATTSLVFKKRSISNFLHWEKFGFKPKRSSNDLRVFSIFHKWAKVADSSTELIR
jgi:hypothetical protein